MREKLALILLMSLLFNGLALKTSAALQLLGSRLGEVEEFIDSLQGATLEVE